MENKEIQEVKELKKLEISRAKEIKNTFLPMSEMLESFEEKYKEIIILSKKGIDLSLTKKASVLRKAISKVRIDSEKLRVAKKADILLEGRAIDGVVNILKNSISKKEESLKKIEKHFEIEIKKKNDEIQLFRSLELKKYTHDEMIGNSEIILYTMPDDIWAVYIEKRKQDFEDIKIARIQAEKNKIEKEEKERLERKKVNDENDSLRKENSRIKLIADKKQAEIKEEALKTQKIKDELNKLKEVKENPIKQASTLSTDKNYALSSFTTKITDKEKAMHLIEDLKNIKNSYKFTSQENIDRMDKVKSVIDSIVLEFGKVN